LAAPFAFSKTESTAPRTKGFHISTTGFATFIVTQDDQRTVYGPGQVFAVADGHPHDESIGPEGARVRVGRKFAKAAPS